MVRDNNLKTPDEVLKYLEDNEYDSIGWYDTTSERPARYLLWRIRISDEIFVMRVISWLFELNKL